MSRADFKEVSILGQGNFSKVFRVRGRRDGCEYAIKRSLREIGSDACYMQWMKVWLITQAFRLGCFCNRGHLAKIVWCADRFMGPGSRVSVQFGSWLLGPSVDWGVEAGALDYQSWQNLA